VTSEVIHYLSKWYDTHNFKGLGIKLILVADGSLDHLKEEIVRQKRSEVARKATHELEELRTGL
jgi:hypothetical protein